MKMKYFWHGHVTIHILMNLSQKFQSIAVILSSENDAFNVLSESDRF